MRARDELLLLEQCLLRLCELRLAPRLAHWFSFNFFGFCRILGALCSFFSNFFNICCQKNDRKLFLSGFLFKWASQGRSPAWILHFFVIFPEKTFFKEIILKKNNPQGPNPPKCHYFSSQSWKEILNKIFVENWAVGQAPLGNSERVFCLRFFVQLWLKK